MLLIAPFLMHLVKAATDAIVTAIIMISAITPNVERVIHRPTGKIIFWVSSQFCVDS